jgi:hypothetical protein
MVVHAYKEVELQSEAGMGKSMRPYLKKKIKRKRTGA